MTVHGEWIEVRHPDTGKLLFKFKEGAAGVVVHIKAHHQPATFVNLQKEREKVSQALDKPARPVV